MSKPVGPYTPIVRSGEWLVLSGQGGLRDGERVEGGVVAEARQTMENIRALLQSAGASMDDVVKTTVFLVDMGDFAAVNEVYAEAFGDHRPARTCVAAAALPLGMLVEVEAWARVGGE